MTPERWQRIEELFHEARERAPAERDAFVEAASADDSALRREVQSLLEQDDGALVSNGAHALAAADDAAARRRDNHAGRRLGPYVLGPIIGAGAMGDVYRARDEKLRRDVAVKILPASLAQSPDRVARSEREARVLAALNHQNIAAIYGLEEQDGVRGLVLELVDGPTLRERIESGGALPMDEALDVARQIARALEAAHAKGVVHRDLKPANIKITPGGVVKVLDFGLAKMEEAEGANPASLPVLATSDGVVLGTVAYMSPEQARGVAVDKRADIWAFGCIVYEMLTGERPFAGDSAADVLGAITTREPDWRRLPTATPRGVRHVLRRCLTKDRAQRLHDIADARIEIDDSHGEADVASVPAASTSRLHAAWLLAGAATIAAAVAIWYGATAPASIERVPMRVAIPLPADVSLHNIGRGSSIAVSPDGRRIVFAGVSGGRRRLYMRSIDGDELTPIPGSEGAASPFFSPDGRWIAFTSGPPGGSLLKLPAQGGTAFTLVDSAGDGIDGFPVQGGTWADDDTIVVAGHNEPKRGLWRVPAGGGAPTRITTPREGETFHAWPQALPGGRAVLYTVWTNTGFGGGRIVVESLATGERATLVEGASYGRVVSPDGRRAWLVFARQDGLHAAPFALDTLRLSGPAMPVVDHVATNLSGGAHYSVSTDGLLAYMPGGNDEIDKEAVWVAPDGTATYVGVIPGLGFVYSVSPDGQRLARPNAIGPTRDLWVDDLVRRGSPLRLTVDQSIGSPIWTPDGQRLIYERDGNLFWRRADGSGSEQQLTTGERRKTPGSVSRDGTMLTYLETTEGGGSDIWLLPLREGSQPRQVLATRFTEVHPSISPDGRWIAYQSSMPGKRFEIYLTSITGGGRQFPVSNGGGWRPLWSPDGRQLYFRDTLPSQGGNMMVVDVDLSGTEPKIGTPRVSFSSPYQGEGDLGPDGRFFLLKAKPEEAAARAIHLITNWFEDLQARVPQ